MVEVFLFFLVVIVKNRAVMGEMVSTETHVPDPGVLMEVVLLGCGSWQCSLCLPYEQDSGCVHKGGAVCS